jgi:hypothetical protein
MAPKFAERPMVVAEQGGTAKAALDAIDGIIDSITKTAGIFYAALLS